MLGTALGLVSTLPASAAPESASEQVWATELAFARSMKERNFQAFGDFISGEAALFAGKTALRGKSKVIEEWSQFFADPDAPFSWEPDQVEVLESGTLAISTGPVRDPRGKSSPGSIRSGASRLRTAGGVHIAAGTLHEPATAFVRSPLTLLIFGTLAGYCVAYAVGSIRWQRRTRLADRS